MNTGATTGQRKIAYITAIFGTYEKSAKEYIEQTLLSDFICFTDNPNLIANNWIIDMNPYHYTHPSPIDQGSDAAQVNSLTRNKHTFNIAKYYKEQWHLIPRLAAYDYVVWLDGTMQISNPLLSEYIVTILSKGEKVITLDHDWRSGSLAAETADSSTNGKYCVHWWNGQEQPYQDVIRQYTTYIQDGYNDTLWREAKPERPHYGVFVTCFVAWPMVGPHAEETKRFLNIWYEQNLYFTTQDQIAFPFVCQKLGVQPYTFPDEVSGGNQFHNIFFEKLQHGL
jgi:hypothetical protein